MSQVVEPAPVRARRPQRISAPTLSGSSPSVDPPVRIDRRLTAPPRLPVLVAGGTDAPGPASA
ncbi:hypothetical protein ABZ614_02775 [Streptomyces sp. NPDC013178]|uniref:hypothetical protein n=1 Tax=unclassified Streptomyces TaxID=2593676 RepID=UPI0033DEF1D6